MPYLDHAGSTMPSKCQMEEIAKLHLQLFLANPHSHHATALKTEQIVNSARLRVLRHFNTTIDDYFVVFTQNTTHALKIVAECFKFDSENSNKKLSTVSKKLTSEPFQFAYLYDSHHSVIGLRHVVKNISSVSCVTEDDIMGREIPKTRNSLFALTAMSNFCGKKYNLNCIGKLQESGWSVCLDAASLVSTSSLDLSVYRPNFVAFSFYKMFGFPTGIGALLIRRDSTTSIEKRSFAGGTVQSVDEMNLFFILRENERAYEEGTLNYYAIAQLQKGFDEIERCGGMRAIQKLTHSLGSKAFAMLKSKKHPNGLPVVEIYSQSEDFESIEKQGSIVAFNLKRPDGGYYGYSEVDKMCAIFGLELRTGCFCNVGACKKYLGITSELIMENMSKGKRCGDEIDLINGKPTGAVRISFGRSSTIEDISALEQMTDTCFVESNESISATVQNSSLTMYTPSVIRLFSYPIKSIGSVGKDRYDLEQKGFKNDRMFMIVQNDVTLNFKMHPELCRLKATITDRNELNLQTVYNNDSFVLSLDNSFKENDPKVVCKNTVSTQDCGNEVARWLDDVIDLSGCRLLRVSEESSKSFVNDSPLLLINEASIYILARHINMDLDDIISRFRSNIVVRGLPPYLEDFAKRIEIDGLKFEVVGPCTRCEMICVDPMTGEKDPSLLLALRNYRNKQKITFGIYIRQVDMEPGQFLQCGMTANFSSE